MDRFKRIADLIEKSRKDKLNMRWIGNNTFVHDSFPCLYLDKNGKFIPPPEEEEQE